MIGFWEKKIQVFFVRLCAPAKIQNRLCRKWALLSRYILWLQLLSFCTAIFCVFFIVPSFGQSLNELKEIRIGEYSDKTRVVFELSSQPSFVIFASNQPQQLIIGLEKTNTRLKPTIENRGLIKRLTYQEDAKNGLYVVIELVSPAWLKQPEIIPGQGNSNVRMVIDLSGISREKFQEKITTRTTLTSAFAPKMVDITSWQQLNHTLPPSPAVLDLPPIPPLKPLTQAQIQVQIPDNRPQMIVVIDAGHGGIDSGTIGIHNTLEKQITLSLAKKLQALLEADGHYKVYMTREDDQFLSLSQRANFARSMKADLFISFHADSHSDASLRGISVYTLSEKSSDAEAQALANKENKADIIGGVTWSEQDQQVNAILIDLLQHETNTRSVVFASLVLKEVSKETTLLRNSHRSAGFMVLKAVEVPSILLEAGYLSNAQEEALLNSPTHQDKLVRALQRAIQEYGIWKNNSLSGN